MMSADRTARLNDFLCDGARLPFVWGQRDCSLWPCQWIKAERGIDPAERLRGTYADALSCARLLKAEGGLPEFASNLAAAAGISITERAEIGDVGVVMVRNLPLLAICTGAMWAIKTKEGLVIIPAAPLKAWRI